MRAMIAVLLTLAACAVDTPEARMDACEAYRAEVATCTPWVIPTHWPDTFCDERSEERSAESWDCWAEHACYTRADLLPAIACAHLDDE